MCYMIPNVGPLSVNVSIWVLRSAYDAMLSRMSYFSNFKNNTTLCNIQ